MLNNIDSTKPDLNPYNLAWLAEMGISYGLLKTYQPQIRTSVDVEKKQVYKQKNLESNDKPTNDKAITTSIPESNVKNKGFSAANILKQSVRNDVSNKTDNEIATTIKTENISVDDIQALKELAQNCDKCALRKQRDQMVFGLGHEQNPDLMIIGEAPGRADDACGYPFQGKAGQLLHFMLLSIGIYPNNVTLGSKPIPVSKNSVASNVYFANLVKCRPVGNVSPSDSEIKQCHPYLQAQINLVKPKAVLVMGSLAAKYLLNQNKSLEDLRSKIHYIEIEGQTTPVVATWHPASLLLQPQNKPLAWSDLQLIKSVL